MSVNEHMYKTHDFIKNILSSHSHHSSIISALYPSLNANEFLSHFNNIKSSKNIIHHQGFRFNKNFFFTNHQKHNFLLDDFIILNKEKKSTNKDELKYVGKKLATTSRGFWKPNLILKDKSELVKRLRNNHFSLRNNKEQMKNSELNCEIVGNKYNLKPLNRKLSSINSIKLNFHFLKQNISNKQEHVSIHKCEKCTKRKIFSKKLKIRRIYFGNTIYRTNIDSLKFDQSNLKKNSFQKLKIISKENKAQMNGKSLFKDFGPWNE